MSDASLRIKNFSISLEAISRINRPGSSGLYDAIEALLEKEIEELQKEQNPIRTARSAGLTLDDDPF